LSNIFPVELVEYWVSLAPGAFHVSDLTKDRDVQQLLIDKLEDLVKKGVVDHHGINRGWYIPRHTELEPMDYMNCDSEPVDVWMPFDLSDKVELYENSIVIISGAPNAGKTAIMLNIIEHNRYKDWDIHYFNSEMSAKELRKRLLKFDIPMENWKFNAYYRNDRFADVIFPGPNSLNIIDFLEVHDEFYIVGKRIKEIHDRLKGGIAVIGLQKNPGSDTGLGGYRSMEVARLALAIDHGTVKISKAKNFTTAENPNGLMLNFKIVHGCKIVPSRMDGGKLAWHRP